MGEGKVEQDKIKLSSRRVMWLASYPKSGNTWVRTFLSAYHVGRVDINDIQGSFGDLNQYFYQVCSPVELSKLTLPEGIIVHANACMHLSKVNGKATVVLKTHNANSVVDRMPLLPIQITKGAIYITRDPRDVAISFAEHLGETIDKTISCMGDSLFCVTSEDQHGLSHVLSSWSRHVDSYLGEFEFPVLWVRYEDMLKDPEKKFREILDFLYGSVNEELLEFSLEASCFKRLQKLEQDHGFRERKSQEKFFARGTAGHWSEILTPEQVIRIEADHGEMMKKCGYDLVTDEVSLQRRRKACEEGAS